MTKKNSIAQVLPVLFGFFVMGFCDLVGVSATHVKADFGLSDTLSNMIPVALFSMFLLFSIPTGMLMNRIGRKSTVQLSYALTTLALVIPLIWYTYGAMLCAFVLLGIANTIIQASLNPLLTNVVRTERLTSMLTAGQCVRVAASFCSPFVAGFAANQLGHWEYIFPIFAGVTILSSLWLMATPIAKEAEMGKASSLGQVFGLLKDPKIRLLFLGIFFMVGLDVGVNTIAPKLLLERVGGISIEQASYGTSYYFFFRMVGAFIGALLLTRIPGSRYFRINIVFTLLAVAALLLFKGEYALYVIYSVIGFTITNVFSIILSLALQHRPDKGNEISGLMVTGVSGGAAITLLMGFAADAMGSQTGAVIIILASAVYLLFCSFSVSEAKEI